MTICQYANWYPLIQQAFNPLTLSLSGMCPLWFNVSKWEKGPSYWQKSFPWRRKCIYFSSGGGVFKQKKNIRSCVSYHKLLRRNYFLCSFTGSSKFQVLLNQWVVGRSGTWILSPSFFLLTVSTAAHVIVWLVPILLERLANRLLNVCFRPAGENTPAHRGHPLPGL